MPPRSAGAPGRGAPHTRPGGGPPQWLRRALVTLRRPVSHPEYAPGAPLYLPAAGGTARRGTAAPPSPQSIPRPHDFRVRDRTPRTSVLDFEEELNGLPAPARGRGHLPLVDCHELALLGVPPGDERRQAAVSLGRQGGLGRQYLPLLLVQLFQCTGVHQRAAEPVAHRLGPAVHLLRQGVQVLGDHPELPVYVEVTAQDQLHLPPLECAHGVEVLDVFRQQGVVRLGALVGQQHAARVGEAGEFLGVVGHVPPVRYLGWSQYNTLDAVAK